MWGLSHLQENAENYAQEFGWEQGRPLLGCFCSMSGCCLGHHTVMICLPENVQFELLSLSLFLPLDAKQNLV